MASLFLLAGQLFHTKQLKIYISILLIFMNLIGHAQEQTMGLFLNDPMSYNGYTLLSNNEQIYLIDNCGKKVHTWTSQYKTGQGMCLMDNGDLLRAGATESSFSAGGRGGIFELFDWNGNVKWSFSLNTEQILSHHDITVLPNGNFLCSVWERKSENEAKSKGRKLDGEIWAESIYEIQIEGNNNANIIWQWSIWDHLIQDQNTSLPNYGIIADHPELLDINYIGNTESNLKDWIHINALAYNEQLDQIAMSSRNLNEIYIIDHSTTTIEATTSNGGRYGKGGNILFRYGNPAAYQSGEPSDQVLFQQHNLDWTPEDSKWKGGFSVFNNEYIANRQSNVLIFSNPTDINGNYNYSQETGYGDVEILYDYTDPRLYSNIMSSVQILPNDNLLILEGESGHIFELNSEDEIVWDYIYPVNRLGGPGIQGGQVRQNMVFEAKRYPVSYSAFENKNLTPTTPIELSPWPSECEIVDSIISSVNTIRPTSPICTLHNTVASETLYIDILAQHTIQAIIFDANGRKVKEENLTTESKKIQIYELTPGLYFLYDGRKSHKFIKV